ncbi:hypothetical protein LTR17_011771 [Elasticomyces elasticus]|nr:hypothetical protein LTR17_011771 [Elasticomyces elasticus]
MPAFLDFTFPFGRQHNARDFHFSGFRSNSHTLTLEKSLWIPELGRSGLQIEMCYSLKSVERSSDPQQPWAIRQCSVYHAYDMQRHRMTWIMIKANRLIQKAVTQRLQETSDMYCDATRGSQTLACALVVHQTLASWADENWHWYINDLEVAVHQRTIRTVCIPLESTVTGTEPTTIAYTRPPNQTRPKARSWSLHSLRKGMRSASTYFPWRTGEIAVGGLITETRPEDFHAVQEPGDARAIDDFTFDDMQQMQYFEERANEALWVLKSNSNVLKDLDREYASLPSGMSEIKTMGEGTELDDFSRSIQDVTKDLMMQESRVESLLRLLADRKTLLQGILQYRSMQATARLAEKAQESTENMEYMTRDMHAIAQKTKTETVHMRIITIVTMFFLPGTFISTLMSTPLVTFAEDPHASTFSLRNIGVGALGLYLVVSLPLVFLTLLTWYGVHKWEQRREQQKLEKHNNDKNHED